MRNLNQDHRQPMIPSRGMPKLERWTHLTCAIAGMALAVLLFLLVIISSIDRLWPNGSTNVLFLASQVMFIGSLLLVVSFRAANIVLGISLVLCVAGVFMGHGTAWVLLLADGLFIATCSALIITVRRRTRRG